MIAEGQESILSYLKFVKGHSTRSVSNLLRIFFVTCSHQSVQSQSEALWHIINPFFEEFVSAHVLIELVQCLTYLAVDVAMSLVNLMQPTDQYVKVQHLECIKYLKHARELK